MKIYRVNLVIYTFCHYGKNAIYLFIKKLYYLLKILKLTGIYLIYDICLIYSNYTSGFIFIVLQILKITAYLLTLCVKKERESELVAFN